MKFIISRTDLGNLIRKIQNVVPQNPSLPILSHFTVEAVNDTLIFTATDLTVGMRCVTTAKVFEEGSITLPSRRFFQLIRELTDATLEITGDKKEMIEIKTGSSRFRLNGMDKSQYPSLPDLSEATKFTMKSEVLKEMLYRTSFAVSKDDNRYVLTGVLLKIEAGKAVVVGTDGKRLAKMDCAVPLAEDFYGEYVLPLKAVDEILKILGESEETIVYLMSDKLAIESGNTLLVTKLLSGDYPDFQQIIPSQTTMSLTLHREEITTLLRQISLFTTDSSQSVRFSFSKGELVITANSVDIGEGKVSMPVDYTGGSLEIAFNPHFFLDILRHSKDETMTLGLSDSYSPGILTDSTSSLFVIMPMRLYEPALT